MPNLQRDREGNLRVVERASIDRRLYDEVCELLGNRGISILVDSLLLRFLKDHTPKTETEPDYANMHTLKTKATKSMHSGTAQTQDQKILEEMFSLVQMKDTT